MYNYFRMKQLPKPEYKLLQQFKSHYNLEDDREAILIALRLMYEVHKFNEPQGKQWVIDVVNAWRSTPNEARVYEV